MTQAIVGGFRDYCKNNGTVEYNTLSGGESWATDEEDRTQLVSAPGKIKDLSLTLGAAPGAGKSYTFTLRVNGEDSELTITISDLETVGEDTVHEVDVVAGDKICLKGSASGTPTIARFKGWRTIFDPTVAGESLLLGVAGYSVSFPTYYAITHCHPIAQVTEALVQRVCPTNGKIKNLYVELSVAPGAGCSRIYTLRLNGEDTELIVTISNTNVAAHDTEHEITVAPTDLLSLKETRSGVPPGAVVHYGTTFNPNISGESPLLGSTFDPTHASTTEYNYLANCSVNTIWDPDEIDRIQQTGECVLKKFYMHLATAPGVGKSYTFTVRRNEADTDLAVTISGLDTDGSNIEDEVAFADGDRIRLKCTPSGSPEVSNTQWGVVSYIEVEAPPVEGTASGSGIGLASSSAKLDVFASALGNGIGLSQSSAYLEVLAVANGQGIGLGSATGEIVGIIVHGTGTGSGVGIATAQGILDVIAQAQGGGVGETTVQAILDILAEAGGSGIGLGSTEALLTRYDLWTYWNVDAYAVAVCSYGSVVFAFRIDATDGHLYRCDSSDNAENWGSWIDMGDVTGVVGTRLASCFKDAGEAIVLYSIGGTLYRRRWNGSTWETAAAWSNSLSSITGIAVTYMGDWNVVVTGIDSDGRAGVWTCVLGNGYSAAVDSWSALKDIMIAESGSGISFHFPSLSMPDVFRMFFVETYSGSESYSRPYWSHSLATADFISNLWREPIPFNLDSAKGLALCYKSPYAWLSRPDRVWRSLLSPPFAELTDSLLSVSSRIIPYRGGIDISLRNDDRRFNSLGSGSYESIKKGSEILISWGYHTTAGKETGGFDPTTWIESWEHVTRGGVSELILHTFDGWDLLDLWRARRQFTWSHGSKNIYQLLALIFARAGLELSAFSTSTALVNQYPAFTINPGESGLTAVKRLLSMVPDVIFFVRDTAYLKNPLAADSIQYAYGTDHVILEGSYRELALPFNRAQVFGDGVFTEDWDWDEIALVHDRLAQASDINIDSTTKAHQRGYALLRGVDIEGLNGHILVPMNCGQDLFDVISITSPQVGLNASKRRVISLSRTWTPNKPKSRYQMRVGLGAP